MTGGSHPRLPCLDVTSRYLIHVSNVSPSLNWKRLKEEIGRAVYGRVRFVETFEAWLGREATDAVIEFDGSRGLDNFIRLEQWWLDDHFKSTRVIVNALLKGVSREEFFAHVRHVTGVNLLYDRGRPPRRWVDELRQRKEYTIGVKRGHAGMPVNPRSSAISSSKRIDNDGGVERKRTRRSSSPSNKGGKEPPHFTSMLSSKNNGGKSLLEGLVDEFESDDHSTTASDRSTRNPTTAPNTVVESAAVKNKVNTKEGELHSEHTDGDENAASANDEQREEEMSESDVRIDKPQMEEMGLPEAAASGTSAAGETEAKSLLAVRDFVPVDQPRDMDVLSGSSSPKEATKSNQDSPPASIGHPGVEAPLAGDDAINTIVLHPSAMMTDNDSRQTAPDLDGVVDQGSTESLTSQSAASRRSRNLVKLVTAAVKKSSASEQTKPDSVALRSSVPDVVHEVGEAGDTLTDASEADTKEDDDEKGNNSSMDEEGEADPGWINKLFEF